MSVTYLFAVISRQTAGKKFTFEMMKRRIDQLDNAIFKLILEAMRPDKADTLLALGGHDGRWQQRAATRIGLAHPNGDAGYYVAAFSAYEKREERRLASGLLTRMATPATTLQLSVRTKEKRVATLIGFAHPNGISQNGADAIKYIAAFSAHEIERWQFVSGLDARMA